MLWDYHIWPLLCLFRFLLCAFLKGFNHKWVLDFVKGFFCIYWYYHIVFIFQFANVLCWLICIYWRILASLEYTQLQHVAWASLMYCLILFTKMLLRMFASMFISYIGLWFSFLCVVFFWFWYQGDGGLIEWVWKYAFLCNFLKEFKRIGISSSLVVWQNSPVKPSGPGL